VGLLHLVDEAWRTEALPEDDLVLPEGHQINLDESDDTPEDRAEERWQDAQSASQQPMLRAESLRGCELPLTHFLEEEAEVRSYAHEAARATLFCLFDIGLLWLVCPVHRCSWTAGAPADDLGICGLCMRRGKNAPQAT
ncbi:unnamed protein product, partial [Effrenium voratum]